MFKSIVKSTVEDLAKDKLKTLLIILGTQILNVWLAIIKVFFPTILILNKKVVLSSITISILLSAILLFAWLYYKTKKQIEKQNIKKPPPDWDYWLCCKRLS